MITVADIHTALIKAALAIFGMVVLFMFLAIMFMLVSRAEAHESHGGMIYPAWCCNGTATDGDCQEIPSRTVTPMTGGYRVHLRPGDHRLVTREHVFEIPQKDVLPSTDGQFHICLYPNEDHRQCFMAPPPGA